MGKLRLPITIEVTYVDCASSFNVILAASDPVNKHLRSEIPRLVQQAQKEANLAMAAIKRHVDQEGVEIVYRTICSHCGNDWEEVDQTNSHIFLETEGYKIGMPLCCDAAQREFNQAQLPVPTST